MASNARNARLPGQPFRAALFATRGAAFESTGLWAGGLAAIIAVAAAAITPPSGTSAAAGYAGWPRLLLYASAGLVLAATSRGPVDRVVGVGARPRTAALAAVLTVVVCLALTLMTVARLRSNLADPLGPGLWVAAMGLLLGASLFQAGWPRRGAERWSRGAALRLAALVGLLVLAAALRLPALGEIPRGINADEGDRAASAFDVLSGEAPPSWFDSGWYHINLVYFRLLAVSMAAFGPNVAGGRVLSALAGIGFVGAVAWLGVRAFNWRVGLTAALLATGSGIALHHSRVIAETGPTALLWAISLAGLFEGARWRHRWGFVVAGLAGGLSLYFYPSARLWAVGAALTFAVFLVAAGRARWRHIVAGGILTAAAAVVAAAPFLVHLEQDPGEATLRFQQTSALDPENQQRLPYVSSPEPLGSLLVLQTERALGMFDRYADGGGFWPTDRPVLPPYLAGLALVGIFAAAFGAVRDARLAVLSGWFWVGLSGVLVTVETPNVIRAVSVLPVLYVLIALALVELTDRVVRALRLADTSRLKRGMRMGVPVLVAGLMGGSEAATYFAFYSTMPAGWASATLEGRLVAELGGNGPVYSVEVEEHLVRSGWVRLLAPGALRGSVPNLSRELPILAPVGRTADPPTAVSPRITPSANQGLAVVFAADANQAPYFPLLQALYPGGVLAEQFEGRHSFLVSPAALASTQGVMLRAAGQGDASVPRFGDVPDGPGPLSTPTWSAGVSFARAGTYRFELLGPGRPTLAIDGVPISGGAMLARGLHFVQVAADQAGPDERVRLLVSGPAEAGVAAAPPRELEPAETYRRMDAPWGLLGRVESPAPGTKPGPALANAFLDATVAMAFVEPELAGIPVPNTITWSGTLLAPRSGAYRMAFASEDGIDVELDGRRADVPAVLPDAWARLGQGATVPLTQGSHPVRVTLHLTHGGRHVARWNWVPPRADGSPDGASPWEVVPPMVLRPDPPVMAAP